MCELLQIDNNVYFATWIGKHSLTNKKKIFFYVTKVRKNQNMAASDVSLSVTGKNSVKNYIKTIWCVEVTNCYRLYFFITFNNYIDNYFFNFWFVYNEQNNPTPFHNM